MIIKSRVKPSTYFDSITLMKIARTLTSMPGIDDATAIMATEPNLQLLDEAGLTPPDVKAGPSDILFVVRASDEASADLALQAAEDLLTLRPASTGQTGETALSGRPAQPRSLEQAIQEQPAARLAVISVPGPYAALEAEQALRAGIHVFLFSDNVPLDDELALKKLAQERDLLVMGPDCGTAMFNGVGLGFVNVVPRGSIGIVGASGTGIQQVMSLIAQRGGGVSQVIGCGGRDLSEAVGAITTLQGLRLLQQDEQTKVIVIVSKPPAPNVAQRVLEQALTGNKPVIVIFVGADHDALLASYGRHLIITRTLAEAAYRAVSLSTEDTLVLSYSPQKRDFNASGIKHRLAALFSGGTLCDEAMHIWAEHLGTIYSNIPLQPDWRIREGQQVQGHYAIDFGADEYTRGRPHPMIDPGLRLRRLQEEASNPAVGVILLDMVLGYCAHADHAAIYGPPIKAALEQARQQGRSLSCVISLCGTEGDPQQLSVQAAKFREVGAEVFTSNAEAAWRCLQLINQ